MNGCQRQLDLIQAAKVCTVVIASFLLVDCRPSPRSPSGSSTNKTTFYTSPPFSTKEPDRYRATRTVTVTESTTDNFVNKTQTVNVFIARDGGQRREEYEAGPQGRLVFLENAVGRFILLPQAKLYADANEESSKAEVGELQVEAELTSPDLLLHESAFAIQYQELGAEVIAGRTATKYKVVDSKSSGSETFVWVDETLGMPIATQSTSTNDNGSTRVSMEMHDISTEVDSRTFVLPADYRKVAAAQILALIRGAASATDLLQPKQ